MNVTVKPLTVQYRSEIEQRGHREVPLGSVLGPLRQEGGSFLICGDISLDDFKYCIREQFMGTTDGSKHRIAVMFDSSDTLPEWLPNPLSGSEESVHIADFSTISRSADATEITTESTPTQTATDEIGEAVSLVNSINDNFDLDPGQLKVFAITLDLFAERTSPETLERFLTQLRIHAKRTSGQVYFVYPEPKPNAVQYRDNVDGIISLRRNDRDQLEQNWDLEGYTSSGWFPFSNSEKTGTN